MLRAEQQKPHSITSTMTLSEYGLGGVECPICANTGYTLRADADGYLYSRECECMEKRRNIKRLRESGLADLLRRNTFDTYQTPTEAHRRLKARAIEYAGNKRGWLYICGKPGSGKTHLCTAICGRLISKRPVRYVVWRELAPSLKSLVNDATAYREAVEPLKTISVLYVDDFLKGGVTDADLNLVFEIVNARYNNSKLRTIISSERSLEAVLGMDEAIGSRIAEAARGYILKTPDENWRLKR